MRSADQHLPPQDVYRDQTEPFVVNVTGPAAQILRCQGYSGNSSTTITSTEVRGLQTLLVEGGATLQTLLVGGCSNITNSASGGGG